MINKKKQYICEICNFLSENKKDYTRHLNTIKHKKNLNKIMKLNDNKNELNEKKLNKNDFLNKNKLNENDFLNENKLNENDFLNENKLDKKKEEKTNLFYCDCGRNYPYRSSLFNHKKKCFFKNDNNNNDNNLKDLVCKLITQNNELTNTIIKENIELKTQLYNKNKQINELIPKVGDNITNNYNQNFNINIFLNEKCKDALNMNEFIEKIKMSIYSNDFKNESNLNDELNCLIIENINKLGTFKRPLHCTDVKKEILYIKDNNSWFKDEDNKNIKNAINNATLYQYKALHEWVDNNKNDDFFVKSISSLGKNSEKLNTKLIKSLCNKTYLRDKILNKL